MPPCKLQALRRQQAPCHKLRCAYHSCWRRSTRCAAWGTGCSLEFAILNLRFSVRGRMSKESFLGSTAMCKRIDAYTTARGRQRIWDIGCVVDVEEAIRYGRNSQQVRNDW